MGLSVDIKLIFITSSLLLRSTIVLVASNHCTNTTSRAHKFSRPPRLLSFLQWSLCPLAV